MSVSSMPNERLNARRRSLHWRAVALLLATAFVSACAAGKAYRMGGEAMKAGDWDQAVAYYRTALNDSPDNANYKIGLERAQLAASRAHFEKAREFESKDQIEAARGEYQLASEYDPSNRQAAAKVVSLDQTIRARIEAARPRPAIEQLRERARNAAAEPLLNPTSREPIRIKFTNANLREILDTLGVLTGINIVYDPAVPQTATTVTLDGVTIEQALQQIMSVNQLSYKVMTERAILVFPDNQGKHNQYDEQVVQTFFVSHADVTELTQLLLQVVRMPQLGVLPVIQPNKTANSITVRATPSVVQIIERVIAQNDKAKAEIVVDVEILEVNRSRTKQYGLNLSEYALGSVLSPEVAPAGVATATPVTVVTGGNNTATGGQGTTPSAIRLGPPFNLNTISRGISTADFYLAVPAMIAKFLESDSQTKVIAKPQLRGAEGTKMSLQLGDRIPVIQTSYTPLASGGANVNPLSSYTYQDIGVNIDMTPRVTPEGDIIIDLVLDNSARGQDVLVAGQLVPSFGQRKLTTRLRLRDGESNLLAGLLREEDRKSLQGVIGTIHVPLIKDLFASNDKAILQTDIVMLLTPHIIRSTEITEIDLKPVYIGAGGSPGIGGPPPLIGNPEPAQAPAAPGSVPGTPPIPVPGGFAVPPPGSSPIPGTTFVPNQPPPGASAAPTTPAGTPTAASAPTATATPPTAAAIDPAAVAAAATPPSAGVGSATVALVPSGGFRVGGGPYPVPVSIQNAARVSTITLTLTYDPAVLRVRAVNEGTFMRMGGANATFTQQTAPGRVDFTITRAADALGASGAGLLGNVLFDAIAPGNTMISISGAATGPGGTAMGLQFRPAPVSVQP
jgi:general secretion pathway protein D